MHHFSIMRSTGQCQLFVTQSVSVRRTAFNQRQRLQHLNRGARVEWAGDITQRNNRLALAADDTKGAAVKTLDEAPTRKVYENRIWHAGGLDLDARSGRQLAILYRAAVKLIKPQ